MENKIAFARDHLVALRRFVNDENAFGPEHFDAIGVENWAVFEHLFDSENKIYSRMSMRNPLIIGRRGSGKSSFLQSRKQSDSRRIVVELNTGSIFISICRYIERLHKDDLVEHVAEVWANLIDLILMIAVGAEQDAPATLRNLYRGFIAKYPDTYRKKGTNVTYRVAHYVGKVTSDLLDQIHADVASWVAMPFDDVKQEAINYLKRAGISAECLIDSLEEYRVSKELHVSALSGLFRCVSTYSVARHDRLLVHLSVPSELYSIFEEQVTKGVIKDFTRATWLYWHASELLSVCAKRWFVFLVLYRLSSLPDGMRVNDLNDKQKCQTFIKGFLPDSIPNSHGRNEEPIAYILRHTQLIPRHALQIFNHIFRAQQEIDKSATKLSVDAIKRGVERPLKSIAKDVIVGYREKYPYLADCLRSIVPMLPLYFVQQDVDKVFAQRIKSLFKRLPLIQDYASNSSTFVNALLDIGVVGRVLEGGTEAYVRAEFAYTLPSRDIAVSDTALLCFHPIFAKSFQSKIPDNGHKPVYPVGTDVASMFATGPS
jgi:hypothetical protein